MKNNEEKIISSKSLHDEMNAERKKQDLGEIPAVNALSGGTSTIARKDKSWSSVPDFIVKLFKKKK